MRKAALAMLIAPAGSALASEPADFFETRVRPVLAKNCYACHTDAKMGGLQLDSREHLLHGGKSGVDVVPGDAAKSRLVLAVSYTDPNLKMPPTGKLTASEIEDLKTWIQGGAAWPASEKVISRP